MCSTIVSKQQHKYRTTTFPHKKTKSLYDNNIDIGHNNILNEIVQDW